MSTSSSDSRQGIQSIEVGFQLLDVLASTNRPMMLRDIARGAGMPAAKAHRYMVSFMRIGLVEQERGSGRYDLGHYALKLGLASLNRLDTIRLADPVLDDLCEEIKESVALAVWGSEGPTIIRIVDAGGPVTITLRAGTVLPVSTSATGRAFAAFHRSPFVKLKLTAELDAAAKNQKVSVNSLQQQLEASLCEVRAAGLSRATGSLTPGINGFSAPVFDHTGQMVAAITSLGPVGEFNVDWDGPVARAMLKASHDLSRRIGQSERQPN